MNELEEQIERKKIELEVLEHKLKGQQEENLWPKQTTLSLHGDKENNYEIGEKLGLSGDAVSTHFRFALYEVLFDTLVNKNGTYNIIEIRVGGNTFIPTTK